MKRAHEDGEQGDVHRIVTIDAGGTEFKTTRHTLLNAARHFPYSVLAQVLAEERADGRYFVDTDGKLFRHILQLLRRPCLSAVTPLGVTAEVWHAELDYWGLSETVLSVEERSALTAKRTHARHCTALEQLGEEIRTEIRENEVAAVRALLDHSGYTTTRDKVRQATLMVPMGAYRMACGSDLGHFLYTNAAVLLPLLKRVLGQTTAVDIRKATPVKYFEDYHFAGNPYSTKETPTLIVKITYNEATINQGAH